MPFPSQFIQGSTVGNGVAVQIVTPIRVTIKYLAALIVMNITKRIWIQNIEEKTDIHITV
jgi:hypothetical protein